MFHSIMYNQNPNLDFDPSYFQEQMSNFREPILDHHVFNDQSWPLIPLPKPDADPPVENMRKDRHRKICTAQGVRGRRMRLPFQVARKFFDLQDMLGFDRAAETIEWLMTKSQGAIKEITIASSKSEKSAIWSNSSEGERKKRQLRENARTRARERTREKMTMRSIENFASSSSNPNSSFDSSSSHQSLYKQFSNVGIDADSLNPVVFDNEYTLGRSDIYINRNSFSDYPEDDPYKWLY